MISLLQLNELTCRFPVGDPQTDDFGFCGHSVRDVEIKYGLAATGRFEVLNPGSLDESVRRLVTTVNAEIAASESGGEDPEIKLTFTEETVSWTADATGTSEVARQASEQAGKDLLRAELIAAPLTLIALIIFTMLFGYR